MVNHHFLNNALTPFYFITIFQANPHHIVGYIRYYIFIRVRIYIYIHNPLYSHGCCSAPTLGPILGIQAMEHFGLISGFVGWFVVDSAWFGVGPFHIKQCFTHTFRENPHSRSYRPMIIMNLMNRSGSVLGSCGPICPILVVNSHGYNPVNPAMGQPITLKLLAIHHYRNGDPVWNC